MTSADEGITGTSARKRPEFLRMIRKCRQKKIDLVLVKSISRFARNTVDCLNYVRVLRSLGIAIIFEEQNINTLETDGEMLITMMGAFAQAESESLSGNVQWGIRQAMREGKVHILDPEATDFEETLRRLRDQGRKRFRILGRSWWPEELPSDAEYMEALNTLERAGWKVDYVVTHCAPTSIARTMNRHYQPDALTDFLELVNKKLDFQCWFLGHYHDNRILTAKHILLWEQIIQII